MAQLGHDPTNDVPGSIFKPAARPPKPPTHLTPEEKKIWAQTVRANAHAGAPGYLQLLEAYVSACSRRRRAAAEVERDGFTVTTTRGEVKSNPAVAVLQSAESAVANLAAKLSIAASSRSNAGRKPAPSVPELPKPKRKRGPAGAPLRLA